MSDYKKKVLINNTIVYAVGNFGSKILVFLIVPLYSYFITTGEMGSYDLILTTISLLTPILILQLNDGVYRWLIENDKNNKIVISSSCKMVFLSLFFATIIYLVYSILFDFPYKFWIWSYAVSHIIYVLLQQVIRGIGNNKLYSGVGLLYTSIFLSGNIFGLVIVKMGITALLISATVASLICSAIFIFHLKLWEILLIPFDKIIITEMLRYSLPLIPNVMCWWIVSSIDRYTILFFLGKEANGIYSIASKYPAMVTVIADIFYLAWQDSAIREYNSSDRDSFYSEILNKYIRLLFLCIIVCIPAMRIFAVLVMESAYKDVWVYSRFLFLGTVFSAISSFLGMGYSISKNTNLTLFTTFTAASVDIVLNILLMRKWGLEIASFSTFISYVVLAIIRYFTTQKYFKIYVDWKQLLTLLLVSMIIGYLTQVCSLTIVFIMCILIIIFGVFINRLWILSFFKHIKH